MKVLRYILYGLIILGAGTLLGYLLLVEKSADTGDIIKCGLLIAAAIFGMVKTPKGRIVNKKAVYQKAYSEFIQNAFSEDPKLERMFYNAVHDFNRNRYSAAMAKLDKLRKQCQRTADLRAVTTFQALCLDDMGMQKQAAEKYEEALRMHPNSSIASNLGLCYSRLGKLDLAEKNYLLAISIDPTNAFAYNNMAAMLFRQLDYARSLEYALKALEHDNNLPQALGNAAT